MAKTIVDYPSATFSAHRPGRLVVASDSASDEYVEVIIRVGGVIVAQHKREFFVFNAQAQAVFDLAQIAKDFFSNTQTEINAATNGQAGYTKAYSLQNLYVNFTAEVVGVSTLTFTAVRTILPDGTWDFDLELGAAWTYMPHYYVDDYKYFFKYYPGYSSKTLITLFANSDSTLVKFTHGSTYPAPEEVILSSYVDTAAQAVVGVSPSTVFDSSGGAIFYGSGTYGYWILPVVTLCVPTNPFYVRWIDKSGGYEHFMFSIRRLEGVKIDDIVEYEPYIESAEQEGTMPRQVSLKAERYITVGAEGVLDWEFEILRGVAISPLIEYYDEVNEAWKVLTIRKGDSVRDKKSLRQSVEFEFNMPKLSLQF